MKTVIKCLLVTGVLILPACSRFNRDPYADTPTSGIIKIAVDETFKPVAEAEVSVFAGIYRYSDITPLYHPESDCFLLLMDDSVRLAITARTLSPGEKERL